MLKLLINIWLIGSGRKCTQVKYHENKHAAWWLIHTEKDKVCVLNSVPLGSGFWHRMRTLRTQGVNRTGYRFDQSRVRTRIEIEQIKKRSEALKRAREFDEAARKGQP